MASKRQPGKVRIIGGDYRRRWLPVASVEGLRPTTDRIRETVFNWLTARVAGARVLDVFAGTGALGFEALSRGARAVTLIERDRQAAAMLRENAARLASDRVKVIAADARDWLRREPPTPFDLVFVDPPFRDSDAAELCTLLAERGWLAPDAAVYVEQASATKIAPAAPFECIKEKTAGQVHFGLYTVSRENHHG